MEAASSFDRTILGYLKYRADTPQHLARTLAADPEFGLAHCLAGYFAMLSYKLANVPVAAEAARTARANMSKASPRELAHVEALDAWIAGDIDRTLAIWESIVAEHPLDVLAFRLAHFNNFWLGRREAMLASAEQVFSKWGPDMPGYGTILSCLCFANEECGHYAAAEPSGWAALEIDPADFWGIHAVAHVMEMQGRQCEGIDLLKNMAYELPMQPFEDYRHIKTVDLPKFLVTTGFTKLQWSKVKMLGIEDDFVEIHIVDPETSKQTKRDVFADIMKMHNYKPEDILVIGDDPESEIKAAIELGIDTFLFDPENKHADAVVTHRAVDLKGALKHI